MEAFELNISEDPVVYSSKEVKSLLQRIDEGNRATGGLSVVAKVYGIAGIHEFIHIFICIHMEMRIMLEMKIGKLDVLRFFLCFAIYSRCS